MALFEQMMVPCVKLTKLMVSDGEGGWNTSWTDSHAFSAAIHRIGESDTINADKPSLDEAFEVTTRKDFSLGFHDVFRRVSDGKTFRVTSDAEDRVTPDAATFAFRRVTAQAWELPSGGDES